jgi:hypothetical protein
MSKFFDSLKNDLLDRRLLPFVALVAVGLIAAIAYAAFAGSGSGSSATPTASVSPSTPAGGIAVSAVKSESESGASETTSGAAKSAGAARNPFTPLSEPKAASASSPSTATSPAAGSISESSSGAGGGSSGTSESGAGSSSSGTSESGGGSKPGSTTGGGTTTTPTPKKTTPKSQTSYAVAVLLGAAAPGTPAPNPALTLYESLKLQQPLPNAKQPLIVYRGAIEGGKSAAFTLVGEVIPHGGAQCLPSTTQCQTITLKPGETEELEYVPLGGTTVNYELYVVAIDTIRHGGSPSSKGASVHPSTAGAALLRKEGLGSIPGLRFSAAKGALVLASHRAF